MALDRRVRGALAPVLDALADGLARRGVTAGMATAAGLVLGLGAAALAATGRFLPSLAVFLLSRLADGLDGPIARRGGGGTDLGGLLDVLADFLVYGAFVVGCGIALPDTRVASLVLLLAYYVNGSAFLALSSVAERRRARVVEDDGRSLQFVGGLTEGTETIVAHGLMALFGAVAPDLVVVVIWVFAAAVGVTIVQRVTHAVRVLR